MLKYDLKKILAPMCSVLLEHVEFHSITTLGSSQPDSQKFTGGAKHYSLNLNLVESCLLTWKWNLNNELENSQSLKLTFLAIGNILTYWGQKHYCAP